MGVFGPQETDQERKKEAVLFIQQCCAIAKNIQQPTRQQLYNNFLGHGLLSVINFALRHSDVGVRVGATDVLVSMIDHDPQMIRQTIFRQINEKQTPLTDSLIDLLLVEADLGVKAQIADAIKVLLDPGSQNGPLDNMSRGNGDIQASGRLERSRQHGFQCSSSIPLYLSHRDTLFLRQTAHSSQQILRTLREVGPTYRAASQESGEVPTSDCPQILPQSDWVAR